MKSESGRVLHTHHHKVMYHVGAEMRSILSKNNAKSTSTPYFADFGAVVTAPYRLPTEKLSRITSC